MFVVAAVWLVGFLVAYSDLLEMIPGRRTQRLIGWLALGTFYVAFRYAPEDAGAALIEASSKVARKFNELILDDMPSAPTTPPTTTTP